MADDKELSNMKIADLKTGDNKVRVEGVISEKQEPREVNTKFGRKLVGNAILEDDSGTITLVLWEEDIGKINEGDRVRIINGYVSEWNNALQLNIGKYGTMKVL